MSTVAEVKDVASNGATAIMVVTGLSAADLARLDAWRRDRRGQQGNAMSAGSIVLFTIPCQQ
jgi:hypothetical protein